MRKVSKLALASVGAMFLTLAIVPAAQAQTTTPPPSTPPTAPTPTPTPSPEDKRKEELEKRKQEIEKRKEEQRKKLDARKLERCKARENRIVNLMTRMSNRGEKQLSLIDQTSKRTQDFYVKKNLNLAGYPTALADVQARQAAAKVAVDAVKTAKPTFKCDGTDPKHVVQTYQDLVKKQNEALKNYRDSVKRLIQLVKAGLKTPTPPTPVPVPTPTPTTPTPTPTPTPPAPTPTPAP